MDEEPSSSKASDDGQFAQEVGAKETRKLRAQGRGPASVWSGFAMFGMVGWSVAIPTLLGAALGWWVDQHFPGTRSWTLVFLVAGLFLGCANAWRWIDKEHKKLLKEDKHE